MSEKLVHLSLTEQDYAVLLMICGYALGAADRLQDDDVAHIFRVFTDRARDKFPEHPREGIV